MSVPADETVGDLPVRDVGLTLAGIGGLQGLYQLLFITVTDFDQWLLKFLSKHVSDIPTHKIKFKYHSKSGLSSERYYDPFCVHVACYKRGVAMRC